MEAPARRRSFVDVTHTCAIPGELSLYDSTVFMPRALHLQPGPRNSSISIHPLDVRTLPFPPTTPPLSPFSPTFSLFLTLVASFTHLFVPLIGRGWNCASRPPVIPGGYQASLYAAFKYAIFSPQRHAGAFVCNPLNTAEAHVCARSIGAVCTKNAYGRSTNKI